MKKLLPQNPWAATGLGALVGAGIAGYTIWRQYKGGAVSQKEAVTHVVKQSLVFGGVAALSTLAGGGKGGGAGIAAMSAMGLHGSGGRNKQDIFSKLVQEALGANFEKKEYRQDDPETEKTEDRGGIPDKES